MFLGEPDDANRNVPDLTMRERAVIAPLLLLIAFLGIYPKPMLDRIEPSVAALVEHVQANGGGTRQEPAILAGPHEAEGHTP